MLTQRDKIAFLLTSLEVGQLSYLLIQEAYKHRNNLDVQFYHEYPAVPPINVPGACFTINEIFSYDGPAIATDLSTADKLISSPTPNPKLFYVWDLEWLRHRNKNHEYLHKIYNNLILITRTDEYAKMLENSWNVNVSFVIDECKLLSNNELMKFVKESSVPLYS